MNSRRHFLKRSASLGMLAGLGELGFWGDLRPVSADEARPDPNVVRLLPDIEPFVRVLEDTPREKLLEVVAAKIRSGTSYREVLSALLLAGVRNVQPRPEVGFKFHAVLVVNSAHLASINSPDEHRWLPIFWALDYFKEAQADDRRQGNHPMAPVDEALVPPPHRARQAFIDAMDRWDEAAADAAIAGLARSASANEVFELFFRYGCRDFRSIGHKAIFVANSLRTLQCIGWQYAEPVLRSLTFALLKYDGANPAKSDHPADRIGRGNVDRIAKLRFDWLEGNVDSGVTLAVLEALRAGSEDDACHKVVEIVNGGAAPQAVWDAVLLGAGELLVRQPGIVALHAVTSSNALRYAWEQTASDETRRMLLLQNVAFLAMFRQAMAGRGEIKPFELDALQPAALDTTGPAAVEEIFADVGGQPLAAAGKLLAYLNDQGDPRQVIDAARVLIFRKGTNAHDYKFSSAVLEDFYHVSPAWRNRFLASSVFKLRGTGDSDNSLFERTRAALAS